MFIFNCEKNVRTPKRNYESQGKDMQLHHINSSLITRVCYNSCIFCIWLQHQP